MRPWRPSTASPTAHQTTSTSSTVRCRGLNLYRRHSSQATVTLLGACGAGKTSLVFRFMGDDFDSARRPSPGLPKTTHAIVLDRQLIYLNVSFMPHPFDARVDRTQFFVSQKMGEQTAAEGFGVAALLWGTEVATAGARACVPPMPNRLETHCRSEASLSEATMVLFDAQDPVSRVPPAVLGSMDNDRSLWPMPTNGCGSYGASRKNGQRFARWWPREGTVWHPARPSTRRNASRNPTKPNSTSRTLARDSTCRRR